MIKIDNEYLRVSEVARKLRTHVSCVYRWLLSGKLAGVRRGNRESGRWLVHRDVVEAFLKTPPNIPVVVPLVGQAKREHEEALKSLRAKGYKV